MIYTYNELLDRYKSYKNPKDKINREISRGNYYRIKKELYEDNINVEGYLLAGYIASPSYLSIVPLFLILIFKLRIVEPLAIS